MLKGLKMFMYTPMVPVSGTGVSGKISIALPLAVTSIVAGMISWHLVRAIMPPSLILQSLICFGSILASK